MILKFLDTFFCLVAITSYHSEGTDGIANEEPAVVGWVGQVVRLPCNYSKEEEAYVVYWTKVNTSDPDQPTAIATYFQGIRDRNIPDERFNIGADFSLLITNLSVFDEGRYLCHFEGTLGNTFKNDSELTIRALTSTPQIDQCDHPPQGNEIQKFCTSRTSHAYPKYHLDCRVTGFRPNVTLEWTSSGIVKQPLGSSQWTLPDGTSAREVTISVTAKLDEEQNYTCTVKGSATNGTDRSATVLVLHLPATTTTKTITPTKTITTTKATTTSPTTRGTMAPTNGMIMMTASIGEKAGVASASILIVLTALLVVILALLYKNGRLSSRAIRALNHIPLVQLTLPKKDAEPKPEIISEESHDSNEDALERNKKQEEELRLKRERREKLRAEIQEYNPGKFVNSNLNVPKLNLGLFGLMAAGKSSLINSLYYALQGAYQIITEEGASFGSAKTKQRLCHPITPHINIFDNRGMKDYSDANMADILAQIRGERGLDPSQPIRLDKENQIHCAIFVYQHRDYGSDQAFGFITKFFRDTGNYHNRGPMFVVSHKEDVEDLDWLMDSLNTCDVTEDKVGCWENYTSTKHDEDIDKDIKMLDFLKKALQAGDWNIYHQERKQREVSNNPRCQVM